MADIPYDRLVSRLENDCCALILGPEFIFADGENLDLVDAEKKFIEKHDAIIATYLKSDGFFYKIGDSNRPSDRDDVVDLISAFYQSRPMHSYYRKLAELPFKVIVSLSPDDFIEKGFENIGRPYELLYYQKGDFYLKDVQVNKFKKLQERYAPTKDAAVIINLLGLVKKGDSLILTYEDFFDFMKGLLKTSDLKLDLQSTLGDVNSFLFLGFKYNKWYLNFIFFLLQNIQGEKQSRKNAIVYFTKDESDTLELYKNAFKFDFNEDEKTCDFIDNLHEKAARLIYQPQQSNGIGGPTKIAYIASNADQGMPTGSDEEYDSIVDARKNHKNRDNFLLLEGHRAATINELIQQIGDDAPSIVIISAHGNENNELQFKGEGKQSAILTEERIAQILEDLTSRSNNKLECVLFSCCESDKIAAMATKYVKYSIGIKDAWPVEVAPEFAKGFFQTLFNEKNYKDAYKNGLAYVNTYVDSCDETNRNRLKSIPFKPLLYPE